MSSQWNEVWFCITDINNNSFAFCSLFCQGIKARILETFVMLFLLALLILGIVWVASALIDNDAASMESLYGMCLKESVLFILINILYLFKEYLKVQFGKCTFLLPAKWEINKIDKEDLISC